MNENNFYYWDRETNWFFDPNLYAPGKMIKRHKDTIPLGVKNNIDHYGKYQWHDATKGSMNALTSTKMTFENVENGKFIIGTINQFGTVSFSESPRFHDTFDLAKTEALRLAALNKGQKPEKKFLVVEIKAQAVVVSEPTVKIV